MPGFETKEKRLQHYTRLREAVEPLIQEDNKRQVGYLYFQLRAALELQFPGNVTVIVTGDGKPDKLRVKKTGLLLTKALGESKRAFSPNAQFRIYDDSETDLSLTELKERFKQPPGDWAKPVLHPLEEMLEGELGSPMRCTWDHLKANWNKDHKAVAAWLELDEEERKVTEAPWFWWCLPGEDQLKILRCVLTNRHFGIQPSTCGARARAWGGSWCWEPSSVTDIKRSLAAIMAVHAAMTGSTSHLGSDTSAG